MKLSKKRANLRDFETVLKKNRLFVFRSKDVIRLFGWSDTGVKFLLHRYTKRGITVRLKSGLYMLGGATIPDFYLANCLQEPSYVSLETALSHYQIIPETVYTITSITTRPPRERIALHKSYRYHRILPHAFTGYTAVVQGEFTSLVADPEKALVDYYYLVARGQRKPLDIDRLRLEKLNLHKVCMYARLFKNPTLMKLLTELFPQRI